MKKIALAALMTTVISSPAIASDFYVGAKLGPVNYNYSNVDKNGQMGYGIFGGYQINPMFSVELEYASLGGFDTISRQYTGSSFGVNGVGTLPLSEQFSLLGKIGIAGTNISATPQPGWTLGGPTSFSTTGLTWGFAGQFNVTKAFGLRAQFDSYPIGNSTSGTTTANMVSIGGVLKF